MQALAMKCNTPKATVRATSSSHAGACFSGRGSVTALRVAPTTARRMVSRVVTPSAAAAGRPKPTRAISPASEDVLPVLNGEKTNIYEETGQLQLLHESFTEGVPALNDDMNNSTVSPQQLIGQTPMLDLSAYSLNPNVKILAGLHKLNAVVTRS